MNTYTQDNFGAIIELMREEKSDIEKELRVINTREPYLRDMETRLENSLKVLGDTEFLSASKIIFRENQDKPVAITGIKKPSYSYYSPKTPNIALSYDVILQAAIFIKSESEPVQGENIYNHLLKLHLIDAIDSPTPGRMFTKILKLTNSSLIVYDQLTARWKLPNPKKASRENHLFVQILSKVFKDNAKEMSSKELYDRVKTSKEGELIREITSDYYRFIEHLKSYRDFFTIDEDTNLWCLLEKK